MDLRLAALRELIRDPSANYAAVAVAIAALVTFFLVVILALIAFVTPARRSLRAEGAEGTDTGVSRLGVAGTLLLSLIVVLGIGGAAGLWYQQTSSDTFCAQTCHSMEKAALSWSRSPHATVSCIRCHEDSGLASVPRNSAYRLFYVYRQYASDGPVVPLAVPASRCLSCHTDLLDAKLIARNGDPFTHRVILTEGSSCRSCHRSQGHEPSRK